MKLDELMQRILFLVPDAKCCAWETTPDKYMGENSPIELKGFLVDWSSLNPVPCPSAADIDGVDLPSVDAKVETERKQARDEKAGKDLSLIACYEIEKKSNPELEFSAYLDSLESKMDKSIKGA